MTNDLETWLATRNYRRTTTRATLGALGAIESAFREDDGYPVSYDDSARRILTWLQETGRKPKLQAYLKDYGATPVERKLTAKAKQRKYVAKSFASEDWRNLFTVVREGAAPEDRVIECMMATGLRVGDVLRLPWRSISEALRRGTLSVERKGGAFIQVPIPISKPWENLLAVMPKGTTVGGWLCPESPDTTCAYQRVSRRLRKHAKGLGMPTRVHTHKIRRTVAVNAHRRTENVVLVQQLLGHASSLSTMQYLDEPRSDEVADLQRTLAEDLYGEAE